MIHFSSKPLNLKNLERCFQQSMDSEKKLVLRGLKILKDATKQSARIDHGHNY